ncbi:MAG: beta-propeller fold lactonase family protein [Balneolaceae bacterium]|nr:beta-propeller fold lactonase family protein [Balneolaceae bacterium]
MLVVIVAGSVGHKMAREHVDYVTSTTGFPLNCTSCHGGRQYDTFLTDFLTDEYVSPFNLSISPDGNHLYAIGQEDDSFWIIDIRDRTVAHKMEVGRHPHSVVLDGEGHFAFVSNQWSDTVMKIRVPDGEIVDTYKVGSGPSGLQWDGRNNFLYVVNTFSSDLSIIDLKKAKEVKRLPVGSNPTGAGLSPDGNSLFVLSRRSRPVPFRTPPKVELSVISTSRRQLTDRRELTSAHILENVDYTPDGELALFTMIKPKNLVPAVQVESGWMINHGIGIYSPANEKVYQLLLDEPNRFFADPYDVRVSPDGSTAVVSHSGADYLSIIDMEKLQAVISEIDSGKLTNPENDLSLTNRFVIKRIKTGSAPKGMGFTSDGSTLYYAEYLTDRIGVVDMDVLEIIGTIKVGDADQNTAIRHGQRLFHNAGQTFQHQFSCYTCHPDGHEDGLTYDMALTPGRDITNVQTLRELSGTAPFKWNGHNVSVYMQDGMRFSKFVTRTEAYSPEELVNLTSYIMTQLKHPPNRYRPEDGTKTKAQNRGKAIFERTMTNDGRKIPLENQCITCHPPPKFTNRLSSDVGTSKDHDEINEFDSPNLNNIYESAPYLHDGSAQTLEEIWTVYDGNDRHGVVNDLTKNQLNDLIEYLKSLGSAEYYK